jgi:hypothetical protein
LGTGKRGREVLASIGSVERKSVDPLGARVGKVIRGGQEVGRVGGCPKGGQKMGRTRGLQLGLVLFFHLPGKLKPPLVKPENANNKIETVRR